MALSELLQRCPEGVNPLLELVVSHDRDNIGGRTLIQGSQVLRSRLNFGRQRANDREDLGQAVCQLIGTQDSTCIGQ